MYQSHIFSELHTCWTWWQASGSQHPQLFKLDIRHAMCSCARPSTSASKTLPECDSKATYADALWVIYTTCAL